MNTNPNPLCTSPVLDLLAQIHRELAGNTDGKVATYIPELAKANPNWFGICLVTATGHVYEVGDSRQPFTIQSISKPFVYGMALEDQGRTQVLTKVGMEPTGDAFNSISLEPGTGRPRNPMINAGAIATAALIEGKSPQVKVQRVLDAFGTYAGRTLTLDQTVYRSESETGHRNRAIGHMLRNFDILTDDPTPVVELYFQQCSISVTAHDLGIMAATLANRGVNPLTGKQALRGEYVESVLSVMGSCGMYDYAGEWIYKVGMPAKSGVAGGILAVLPGQLGIGVFSPPLDDHGNSVRGIRVCDALSRLYDLHILNRPTFGQTVLHAKFTGAEVNSNRVRTPEETRVLQGSGPAISVYQLQGNLIFATTETVIREVVDRAEAIEHLILDFRRVLTISESSIRLFYELLLKLAALGKTVQFTHTKHLSLLRRIMKAKLEHRFADLFLMKDDNDVALEWAEDRLLRAKLPGQPADPMASPADYELLEGLSPAELDQVVARLKRRTYGAGEVILQKGDPGEEMFFLVQGRVNLFTGIPVETHLRLASFSPGMVFGELAVLDPAPRSATAISDTDTTCDVLTRSALEQLARESPGIKIKLLENLSRCLCRRLRRPKVSVLD